MISTPDLPRRFWLIAAACVSLAACSEAEPDVPPLEGALAALEEGDGFGAEVLLRDMLSSGTPKPQVAAYLGEAELLQGQPVEARRWLGEGQFSDETAGRGFHMLGRLEMREGNLPAAGTAFDRSIAFTPDAPRLWVDIGRLRYRGGEQSQAVDAAERAVELGPDDPEALLFRGQLARDSEGMAAALPWFEQALQHKPDQLDLLAEYAATLGELGEAQDMLSVVRHMANLNPGYLRGYYLQAVVAARAGQFDLARKLLFRSGEFANDAPAGIMLAGVIDLETGNYASAAQAFDKLFRQQPENRRVRELLARALALGGNHREMLHRFGEAAKKSSASPYLRTLVARSHEALGDRQSAGALLDVAAKKQSGNLVALRPTGDFESAGTRDARSGDDALSLVRNLIVEGNRSEALRVAEGFRERFDGSADALALAGDANLAARRVSRAMSLYRQSARIRQPWPLARRQYAAMKSSGDTNAAIALLQRHLQGHPSAVEPTVILARAQYDRGNLPRAALLLDQALAFGGDRDPEVLALRAVTAMRMGDDALAQRIAQRAMALQPTNPVSLQALAMVSGEAESQALMAKLGNLGGAVAVANR
ncbi:tetratricopeptide repeat protein [Parerythrobacter jejuensis]|nr:tetratricopeptide repeat protein [Parerythrobacter jejuensis]